MIDSVKMDNDNKFCDNALGLGLCYMALNYANNPLYFSMNQNVSQTVNAWNQYQNRCLQSQIDDMKYKMLQSHLQSQIQQAMVPTITFPSTWSEPKKTVIRDIFDLDIVIFPDNPIRDWVEKKEKEIEEKFKWLDEVEFVAENNPASLVDSPKIKTVKRR